MFPFDFFRSFLPLHNPIGFGAGDFIEFALAALLVSLVLLWRAGLSLPFKGWRRGPAGRCCCWRPLPVALRLLLLARHHPVPSPDVYDEFSHLLVADTLRHFRLANPPHPLHQFFETFFVLQQPTYSSIYPLGQGLALALGWTIFGHPWAGVVLAVAAFCALCYWMLRGWTTPGWALVGGLLAVMEFGPLSQWMNGYWGGAVAAAAGCLVFGALPRLRKASRRSATRCCWAWAWRSICSPGRMNPCFCCLAWSCSSSRRSRELPAKCAGCCESAAVAALVVLPAIGLTLLQNRAGHRELDHHALCAQPVSIRRAGGASPSSRIQCRTPD